jgi:hypothetical protein
VEGSLGRFILTQRFLGFLRCKNLAGFALSLREYRAARLGSQAAWKEQQRRSDEWIKTVPKTDYAAIALAGKLARQR